MPPRPRACSLTATTATTTTATSAATTTFTASTMPSSTAANHTLATITTHEKDSRGEARRPGKTPRPFGLVVCLFVCLFACLLACFFLDQLLEWLRVQVIEHRLTQGCQYWLGMSKILWLRRVRSILVPVNPGKNLYRFYSACRQTILFTWKGGMGEILRQTI